MREPDQQTKYQEKNRYKNLAKENYNRQVQTNCKKQIFIVGNSLIKMLLM